jgi:hypothetical protein
VQFKFNIMSLPNHISGVFAIAVATTLTSILIGAAAQADPNPYAQAPTTGTAVNNKKIKGTNVPGKVQILTPGKQPGAAGFFADEKGPSFVKGGTKPGDIKANPASQGIKNPGGGAATGGAYVQENGPSFVKDLKTNPGMERVRPSAVDTIKKIEQQPGK